MVLVVCSWTLVRGGGKGPGCQCGTVRYIEPEGIHGVGYLERY